MLAFWGKTFRHPVRRQPAKLVKIARFLVSDWHYRIQSEMKISPHSICLTVPLLIATGLAQQVTAPLHPPMSIEKVVENLVRKNLERSRALTAYQGVRTYRLEYHGFLGLRTAEMVVDVKYQSPGTKEFSVRSATGSKLILEKVFKKLLESEKEALSEENQARVALNNVNYIFKFEGYENTPNGGQYVLSVKPRTKNKFLYSGKIWINAEDFAVMRIEGEPAKNPSFWTKETKIEQVYTKVGDFWLPSSNCSTSSIRLGGQASFSIEYKDYLVTSAAPLAKLSNKVTATH